MTESEITATLEAMARKKLVPAWWQFWRRAERVEMLHRINRDSLQKLVAASSVLLFLSTLRKAPKQ
jgi:hypothetical protein